MTQPLKDEPRPVVDRMRSDWNTRAEEDFKLHIATGHSSSDEAFRLSGEQDLVELVLGGLELPPTAEALEIGCGVGRLLVPLAARAARAFGVDISTAMVERSRAYCGHLPNVRVDLTDGTLSSHADASLDLVYSFIVFQHIPDVAAVETYVREAARVLVPGGVLRFQVDGRHALRARAQWSAGTYDGCKLSRGEVEALVAGAGLELLEQWGEDTHYHWVTARKPGRSEGRARVGVRERALDPVVLRDVLSRCGLPEPARVAERIGRGETSLRAVLAPLVDRLQTLPDDELVREAFRVLLGRDADRAGFDFHRAVLASDPKERLLLVDCLVTSRGFQDLVRPILPRIPWPRLWPVLQAVGLEPSASPRELLDALEGAVRADADPVGRAFRLVLGHDPDAASRAHHGAVLAGPTGARLLARGLLEALDGVDDQATPEEGVFAWAVLREGAALDDLDFVRLAYRNVLRREADDGGAAFYSGKLSEGHLSRAGLLRDLLRSEEFSVLAGPRAALRAG